MKVYRCMLSSFSNNSEAISGAFLAGLFNEARNLASFNKLSPSSTYLKEGEVLPQEKGKNSYLLPQELYKCFFMSLPETIIHARNLFNYFRQKGLIAEILILELDLPYEEIKGYSGVGFYDGSGRWSCQERVEFKVPYRVLYKILSSKHQKSFYDSLEFYNEHIEDQNITNIEQYRTLLKKLKRAMGARYALSCYSSSHLEMYPYLCFPISDYRTLHLFSSISDVEKVCRTAQCVVNSRSTIYQKGMWEATERLVQAKTIEDQRLEDFNDLAIPTLENENELFINELDSYGYKFKSR